MARRVTAKDGAEAVAMLDAEKPARKKDAGLWTVAIEDPKARYHDEEAR